MTTILLYAITQAAYRARRAPTRPLTAEQAEAVDRFVVWHLAAAELN